MCLKVRHAFMKVKMPLSKEFWAMKWNSLTETSRLMVGMKEGSASMHSNQADVKGE
jgi:hypothetical protein